MRSREKSSASNRAHDPEHIWTLKISNRMKFRDGRLSELWVIPEDQHVYDDYWGDRRARLRLGRR
ncbi:MAG: hypothetical protein ACRD1T_22235, partial [Acidimicrobiia bacterium]